MEMIGDIILGIIQGLTEFLPVSSSGHLALTSAIMGTADEDLLFELLLHLGTLIAVVIVFYKRLGAVCAGIFKRDPEAIKFAVLVFISCIPTAIIGLTFEKKVAFLSSQPVAVATFLFFMAAALFSTKKAPETEETEKISMSYKQAFILGIVQGIAILPGVSRSGSTISAALWMKIPRKLAGEFSFIMSIPVIGGAALLKIKDAIEAGNIAESLNTNVILGVTAAFLSGIISLVYLMKFIQKGKLYQFAYYLWPLSLISLVYFGFFS